MKIIETYKNEVLYYQFKSFNDVNYVNHLFTSRIGWSNENISDKISNIFNIPKANIVNVKQVHGTDIMVIDSKATDFKQISNLERDGLITNIPNIVLTTYHADCVPIYFLDKKKRVIGMAHGGWKGTYNNISKEMIHIMKTKYGSNPEEILVGIGPSIGPCCYEVSRDLGEEFVKKYSKFKDILLEKDNNVFLDLWRINYLQLMNEGLQSENITLSGICTSCQIDKLYSYRKEKGTKNRMVAAISLDINYDN